MNIRDMYFYYRRLDRCNSIADGDRCVSIACGIEDDAIMIESDALDLIDQFSLNVTLIIGKMNMRIFCDQLTEENVKRHVAVDIGLPLAQQVEIGAIDDCDLHTIKCRGFGIGN